MFRDYDQIKDLNLEAYIRKKQCKGRLTYEVLLNSNSVQSKSNILMEMGLHL